MQSRPHIFICPLNWGLGHASRMIPIINSFLARNCRITVAASGAPLKLLKDEFAEKIEYIEFGGPTVSYPKNGAMVIKLMSQLPAFLSGIYREKRFAARVVEELEPDMIISDNCYGMRSPKVLSVIVTHQLRIQMPPKLQWMGNLVNRINHAFITSFDVCLVPDNPEKPGLSGILSHGTTLPDLYFTGTLSRFKGVPVSSAEKPLPIPDSFIMAILSGPEPQRSMLEEKLKEQLREETVVWLRGLPGNPEPVFSGNHIIYDHASTRLMAWYIRNSELVICRSGYSSVMDLSVFGKKAVMIPTPGQTEQEYLAKHLEASGYISALSQDNLQNLKGAIREAKCKKGLPLPENNSAIESTVKMLLKKLPDDS